MPATRARRSHGGSSLTSFAVAILSALHLSGVSEPARSEVRIEGTSEAVRVEARNSNIAEILAALGATIDLRYATSPGLEREITGTFEGPLWRVVARLLEGYDYVVRGSAPGSFEVVFFSGRVRNGKKVAPVPARESAAVVAQQRLPRSVAELRGTDYYMVPRALERRRRQ